MSFNPLHGGAHKFPRKKRISSPQQIHLQIHGTAMGSPFAPNFVNIFMHNCESHLLQTAPGEKKPLVWKGFIDDILLVWTHGEEALLKFLDHCNQCFPTIKFTAEHFLEQINFVDTTTRFNEEGTLESTLFVKEQGICTLLYNDSFHATSFQSQALRHTGCLKKSTPF